jgi:hypothetical protein
MRIQLDSPAQNHFQITLTLLSVNRILHVPGAHAHITPAPQPHYACVRSVLPAYLQRCYEWLGRSELLYSSALPNFALRNVRFDPRPSRYPGASSRITWVLSQTVGFERSHAHVSAVQQNKPQYLLEQTGSFSRTAHDAKNLPIRAQYFCTTVSVLKCPPRAKRWSRIPALSANRLTDRHGTYGSSFAWNIRIFSGVSSRT